MIEKVRLRMEQPRLPLRRRLLHGIGLALAWFVLVALSAGASPWFLVAAAMASGLHVWMWVFGPNGHELPPPEPDRP